MVEVGRKLDRKGRQRCPKVQSMTVGSSTSAIVIRYHKWTRSLRVAAMRQGENHVGTNGESAWSGELLPD